MLPLHLQYCDSTKQCAICIATKYTHAAPVTNPPAPTTLIRDHQGIPALHTTVRYNAVAYFYSSYYWRLYCIAPAFSRAFSSVCWFRFLRFHIQPLIHFWRCLLFFFSISTVSLTSLVQPSESNCYIVSGQFVTIPPAISRIY